MAVTREQALTADRFHYTDRCTPNKTERWRRNGQTKVWVTRPDEFRVPIKFGLRDYGYLTQDNADQFHTEEDCPYGHV